MMSNELSEYERKRLENIKQNQEILKSLNIKGIIPDELKKPVSSSATLAAKKARGPKEPKTTAVKESEPLTRRVSTRLLKKSGGFEGLDEDFVKIESEMFVVPVEPPKPKRIVGKILFDPEEGATSGFLELTSSLKTAMKNNYKKPENGFEEGLEIQNELSVVKVMKERIYSLAVHPDPSKVLVAAGGKFGELSFLDATLASHPEGLNDRELPEAKEFHPGVYSFRPHTGSISNLRYNPANPVQLITTSYDNIVRCLDITTGTFDELYNFGEEAGDVITGFDLDCSGNLLYISDTDGIFRWTDRRAPNSVVQEIRLHEKKIGCVSVCREGKYLATASNDGTVGLWDLRKLQHRFDEETAEALHTMTFRRSVTSVYFNPNDSNKLLSTCYDDHVRVHYNLTQGSADKHFHSEMSHNNQTGRWITNFKAVWDTKSSKYAVVGNMNRGIDVIDAEIGNESKAEIVRNTTSDYLTAQPAVNAFHPNLDVVASGNASGKIALWSRC
jgi:WD repeat-containing protein 76